ncbi:hypothetical protein [Microbacterium hydrocarbonoxydans]|uniref:hypothetical protein n=1 Tax=Microbacterium hydrocarbonoxydans TaxID=273678 RepID=UPI00203F833F|nr:hypothetical protein [Microbacterium hydrocarbonoxydans]MCM3780511.1 hypothetical protein [Microbacterium hydrocarbonoxydans]
MSAVTLTDALLASPAAAESTGRSATDAGARFGEALVAAGESFPAESASSDLVDGVEDAGAMPLSREESTAGEPEGGIVSAALALLLALPTIDGGAPATDQVEPGTGDASQASSPVDVATAEVAAEVPSSASSADRITSVVLAGPAVRASDALAASAPAVSGGTDAAGEPAPDASPRLGAEKTPVATPASVPPAVPAHRIPADGIVAVGADPRPPAAAPVSASAVLPDRPGSGDRAPAAATASASPTITAVALPSMPVSPVGPAATEAAAPVTPIPRTVAAQVSPVVVSIAQRPSGTHQLTMTVNPDTLGPVTVRAHIGQAGDVRVELMGATDAGRDALRAIVTDLRRDLAAAMPHASLSIAQGSGSDPGADRGASSFGSGGAGGEAPSRRDAASDASPPPQPRQPAPATPSSASNDRDRAAAGLDILA